MESHGAEIYQGEISILILPMDQRTYSGVTRLAVALINALQDLPIHEAQAYAEQTFGKDSDERKLCSVLWAVQCEADDIRYYGNGKIET